MKDLQGNVDISVKWWHALKSLWMEGQQLLWKAIHSCHLIKSIFEFLGSVSNFKNVSKWHLELQEWKKTRECTFNDKMTRMFCAGRWASVVTCTCHRYHQVLDWVNYQTVHGRLLPCFQDKNNGKLNYKHHIHCLLTKIETFLRCYCLEVNLHKKSSEKNSCLYEFFP